MKSLVVIYDVDGWDEDQIELLGGEAMVQAEASEHGDDGPEHPDTSGAIYVIDAAPAALAKLLVPEEECAFCTLGELERTSHLLSNRATFVVESKEPKAEKHFLVIPRPHVEKITDLTPHLVQAMHDMTTRIVDHEQLGDGWRLVVNTGAAGKQTVPHVHYHVLAGPEVLADGFTRTIT